MTSATLEGGSAATGKRPSGAGRKNAPSGAAALVENTSAPEIWCVLGSRYDEHARIPEMLSVAEAWLSDIFVETSTFDEQGNQVEGISPLYHVSQLDGLPDKMAAVIQISTRMGAHDLIEALSNVEASVGEDFDLDLIDMEGVTCDEPDCKVPWPTARNHAAVLAPWLDMDPDARLGKDPVSFLLAMAPDTAQVGLLTDNWIIGGTL